LAVLSSDALSSVAYATEEILRVLVLAGTAAIGFASLIAFVIAAILAIVVFSYRQTIHAYPTGGGAYIVSKDNLGEMPALVAAGSLLIDYILTVAVSIAAGVAALTSAFPDWHVNRVELTLGYTDRSLDARLPNGWRSSTSSRSTPTSRAGRSRNRARGAAEEIPGPASGRT
jgi:amino acid transporter